MGSANHPNSTSTATAVSSASSSRSAQSSLTGPLGERDRLAADELAIVLSHYDLGVLTNIQEFPRGSRRAPKLLIRTKDAVYLLKRRAVGKDEPFKVAFCHALQNYLAEKQFPLPHLIGTKKDNNSMLQYKGNIYEIFEYISGTGYNNSLEATQDSGKILALFHKIVKDYQPEYEPPTGSYHSARSVQMAFGQLPKTLEQFEPLRDDQDYMDEVRKTNAFLQNAYNEAAMKANDLGLADWPMQICHSDWHPGNMLFRKTRVVAVIDYDASRLCQRILDVANGALQMSIIGGGDDAAHWPEYVDESRFKRFLRGYDSVNVLSKNELRTIPYLMIEALIAESVVPIAQTGSFARIDGYGFLKMIERKIKWVTENYERLVRVLD